MGLLQILIITLAAPYEDMAVLAVLVAHAAGVALLLAGWLGEAEDGVPGVSDPDDVGFTSKWINKSDSIVHPLGLTSVWKKTKFLYKSSKTIDIFPNRSEALPPSPALVGENALDLGKQVVDVLLLLGDDGLGSLGWNAWEVMYNSGLLNIAMVK